jgi:creatinine amidohydrolase/Fe(II)-dependent formamide hydrolase-like protein
MGEWKLPPAGGHMERPDGVYYQTMNMTQINERLKRNDLIIGQPLGEDTFLVSRMAEQVALKTGCTVAEPVWYGSHPFNHLGMPGTIVVPEDVFIGQLRAIIAGLWNTGFRKQIFLNGHAQEEVMPLALHQFAKKYQVPCMLVSLHWPTAIHDHLKDKANGGPFDTPFKHADEAEASYSLALFPEFMDMSLVVDTKAEGFIPPGHVDGGGEVYHRPIKGHEHIGLNATEVMAYPEGVIGSPTLAKAEKAMKGLDALLDYMCKLIDDIMTRYPAGKLPPANKLTMRDEAEVQALLKGPLNGGKHIYTVAYPP